MTKRLNVSKHSFAIIPDNVISQSDPFGTENNEVNIIFQYRWLGKHTPEASNIRAVVVYGDSPGLNSGSSDELGNPHYVNSTIEKILTHLESDVKKKK